MYYIGYIIIGIGLGGIVFLLIKKLPQFFSRGEAEFKTLLRKSEGKKSWFENIDFDFLKRPFRKLSFETYKQKIIGFFKNFWAKIYSGLQKLGESLKNLFQTGTALFRGLKEKININFKTSNNEDEPSKLQKRESSSRSEREQFEEQKEFFSELLGEREKEQSKTDEQAEPAVSSETVNSKQEDSKHKSSSSVEKKREQEKSLEKKENQAEKGEVKKSQKSQELSREEKEIQQWIEKLKEEPKNGEAYMELGFIYFDKGQKKKAESCLESAKKLGVESERVEELLSELKD